MISDESINLNEKQIIRGDKVYHETKDLLELLFKKVPEKTFVSTNDVANYRDVILSTNAHKKFHKVDGALRRNDSSKFQNFIAKVMAYFVRSRFIVKEYD